MTADEEVEMLRAKVALLETEKALTRAEVRLQMFVAAARHMFHFHDANNIKAPFTEPLREALAGLKESEEK